MRLVYLGTPQEAVPPLQALHDAGHDVALVVTRPDRRRGRGGATSPSPVKAAATELGLPVSHDLDDVTTVGAELGVVVAYGRIIPPEVLEQLPMVNLHFSLLPRWRGAAPVERAILAGDDRTGVCVMRVEEGLDTGDVLSCVEVPIGPRDTAASLRATLVEVGSRLLVETLEAGLDEATPQSAEGVTYAEKIGPEDLRLDWADPAVQLDRVVRVGGAWTTFRGRRLKVLDAEPLAELDPAGVDPDAATGAAPGTLVAPTVVRCGDGFLRLTRVQPEGRAAMDAAAWANGARPAGERFGT